MIRSVCGRVSVLVSVLFLFAAPLSAAETVCIDCHGSMQGALGKPVEQWRKSIHAKNGISCHNCHGGDPTDAAMAMSPERGFRGAPEPEEVPDFCGRCHVGVKEDYLGSAHGQALGKGGPQCVTCHGNHDVVRASPDLINREDCTRCHSYGRAEEIKEAVASTDRMIAELEDTLDHLHRIGIETEKMRGRVFSLRNQFHRLFHSVDVAKVRQQTSGIREKLDEVHQWIEGMRSELHRRKLWGGGAVALLVLGAILSALLRRSYKEEEKRDAANPLDDTEL